MVNLVVLLALTSLWLIKSITYCTKAGIKSLQTVILPRYICTVATFYKQDLYCAIVRFVTLKAFKTFLQI